MKFKHKKDQIRFLYLHPLVIMIYADLFYFVKHKYDIDLVITDTVSTEMEDLSLHRKSMAHRLGLAIDISVKNLNIDIINDMKDYLNNKEAYKHYKYLSFSGIKRLIYFHNNGNGDHLHLAIHKRFSLSPSI